MAMPPHYVTAQKTAAMHGTWVSRLLSGGCVGNVSMCFLSLECSQAAKHHYEERARFPVRMRYVKARQF
ncbi:hypothetical protein FOPG_10544 [Fusarium oxysporum f. sp. conglutinans race 2 54008]|uniref:Uncharacterized protein n=1 Tax=Fusarium oxysporum f. sp. conglutinans race 2 54008 TaxID=1089457 RepID=X0HRH2_FUSOX|nr:hypothetical protein FOPG_10544 [Fusarium oxysporum f. sp. conglutinans race 2 54008]